jgi:hypothetical protein
LLGVQTLRKRISRLQEETKVVACQKDAVVLAKADVRDEQITELQTVIAAKTDSIMLISSERDDFIKLIIAQESQLKKNKPNDEKIIKTYQSLSDSAAHAMFLERYTKSGFFEKY